MRIAIASHNYPPHLGGLETIVKALALGFARQHEVVVITTAWGGKTGISEEEGVLVHRLRAVHATERWGVPFATPFGPGVASAVKAVRNADVVHAHGSLYTTTILADAARRPGVPLFVTEHVGFVPYSSSTLNAIQSVAWRLIGDRIARRAARLVAYNSRVHDWLRRRFGPKSVFIANGVDVSRFAPVTPDRRLSARTRFGMNGAEPVALFVGRAAQKKNLDVILRLPRRNYRLAVCGAERQLPDDVINLGAIPYASMPDVFAACDFLIHPAVGEGFPVTIQEAMASGLPAIVLWDDGYAGSLDAEAVVALRSLKEIGAAIDRLVTSPVERARRGEISRAFAITHWSWESTVASYLRAFSSEKSLAVQR